MAPLWLTAVFLVQTAGMLSHVEKYEVVRPRRLLGRGRRSLKDPQQVYPDAVQYELTIEGRNHTMHLEKNRHLIGRRYTETFYSADGGRVTTSPNQDHCFYHGRLDGCEDSAVSVGICSGISGFVRMRQQVYLIEPLGRGEDGDHAVYRREHLKVSGGPGCGSSSNGSTPYDRDRDRVQSPRLAGLFRSRSWKTKPVSGPQKFVELFVVVDHAECQRYGSQTRSRVLQVVNHVDKLYRPLNIRVVLVGLELWTDRDRIDVDVHSETTLDNFLLWRQADLLRRTDHDNAQFVTGKDFDGDTVGLANKFAMCTANSGGVNQDHHDNPVGLASTIAHEMGHNFGLSHDAAGCLCGPSHGSENCVMAEKLRTGDQAFPMFFSGCSEEELAEFLQRAQPACLSKPGAARSVAAGPRCGDALLDAGEECDCGSAQECRNPCCDASTCRLTAAAQCAHGRCCDNCQLRLAGSVCREPAGECDLPEYCSGASEHCPEDDFQMNGRPCSDRAPGYCYAGRCPTHQQHCWRLFGPGATVGSDACFDLNARGEEGANCGRNQFGYAPCAPPNLMCGSMFCGGGGESITGKRAAYTVHGVIECKLAVDDDKTRNMDMVPSGTRCGPNKVCLANRCVDLSVYGKKEDCAKKCNNNGVCNHKKACHCDPGWAPPFCDIQYADLPPAQSGVIAGVCAAVSVLLLIAAVTAGLLCYKRDKKDNNSTSKRDNNSTSKRDNNSTSKRDNNSTSKRDNNSTSKRDNNSTSKRDNNYTSKRDNNYTSKRKVHSALDRLNPMFQEQSGKERPQISAPTFMESTATQACAPLMAPQPPKKPSSAPPPPSQTKPTKPRPPSKPLPPLSKQETEPPAKPGPPALTANLQLHKLT